MTALNVVITSDAAHLFTDGGLYDANTTQLIGLGNKVQFFPHLNAALASNGWATVGVMLWDAITDASYSSFDEMAAGFGGAIKTYVRKNSYFPAGKFEAVLVGWSEADDAPQAFVVSNAATSVAPFVSRRVTKSLTPYDLSVRAIELDPAKPEEFGLAVMEQQRATRWDTATGGKNQIAVGGFAQHTRLDREGCTVKVLQRWAEAPDPAMLAPATPLF